MWMTTLNEEQLKTCPKKKKKKRSFGFIEVLYCKLTTDLKRQKCRDNFQHLMFSNCRNSVRRREYIMCNHHTCSSIYKWEKRGEQSQSTVPFPRYFTVLSIPNKTNVLIYYSRPLLQHPRKHKAPDLASDWKQHSSISAALCPG